MVEPSNDEIAKIQTDELFDTERRIGDLLARIREKKERENKHATTGMYGKRMFLFLNL